MKIRDFSQKPHADIEGIRFSWRLLTPRYWHHWLGLGLLSLIWLLIPVASRDSLARFIGRKLAAGRWPRRIPENLSRCFTDMSAQQQAEISLEFCEAQACVIFDLPAMWLSSPEKLQTRMRIQGLETLEAALSEDRPVCLLVCHSLGMEHAARALKWMYPVLGYYQPFGAPVVDWLFYRSRVKNGGYLLQRGDSLRHLIRDLRTGWMLYMMIDEDMGEKEGLWVPFFATQKCGLKAPAKLAGVTDAAAVPVYSWYNMDERRYEIQILPALEDFPSGNDHADVEKLMENLENMIGNQVSQYGWRQQLFRSENKRQQ